MNWEEQLFAFLDDLEQHAEAVFDVDRESELADRSRAEYASVTMASRLMASLDTVVSLELEGPGRVSGVLQRVGTDWCLLHGAAQDWVIRLGAVVAVSGASARSVPEVAWSPVALLGIGTALRRLADAGEQCRAHATDGTVRDVVIERVGQDFVEATMGEGRKVLLSLSRLAAVQSRG